MAGLLIGGYDWHIDNDKDGNFISTRRISFTVQLSPESAYEGGELQVFLSNPWSGFLASVIKRIPFISHMQQLQALSLCRLNTDPHVGDKAQGSATVFPSQALHRVSSVTKGERFSLVGWYHCSGCENTWWMSGMSQIETQILQEQ